MLVEADRSPLRSNQNWDKGVTFPTTPERSVMSRLSSLVIQNGGEVRGEGSPSRMLWGAAPTGMIHLGYCGYFGLLQEAGRQGTASVVVVADYHAYLDSEKSRWSELDDRAEQYTRVLQAAGFSDVIRTRESYSDPAYFAGLMKLSKHFGVERCLQSGTDTFGVNGRSAAEVLYVLTQVYDLSYFGVDSVACGLDESDIYRMGAPILAGYESVNRQQWYLPMCPGLIKREMHASDSGNNKILVTDEPDVLTKKLRHHEEARASGGVDVSMFDYLDKFLFPLYGMESVRTDTGAISSVTSERDISRYVERLEVILSRFYTLNN
jgi:tyrosyl-tRNA synthetase